MYEWLSAASDDSIQILTANRRLARSLTRAFNEQQLAAGRSAWRTPEILSLQDWVDRLLDGIGRDAGVRLNSQQSALLWERCLRREVSDPLINLPALTTTAMEAWRRLHEWNVPFADVEKAALGRDQHRFANAASHYRSLLEQGGWSDAAQSLAALAALLDSGAVPARQKLILAGFDRLVPALERLLALVDAAGGTWSRVEPPFKVRIAAVCPFDSPDAELRAAGAWARQARATQADARLAVVVSGLSSDAERQARLVAEGFHPGWQLAAGSRCPVNVSYGRSLAQYPACAVALTLLRWLARPIGSVDISMLLRSTLWGDNQPAERSGIELALRDVPDRDWTPERFRRFLRSVARAEDELPLPALGKLIAMRDSLRGRSAPSHWAGRVDEILTSLDWPGEGSLSSEDFQLVNRWRELLNDFARLDLVSPAIGWGDAVRRLQQMAAAVIYQPESAVGGIDLLGPLEAAGLEYDGLWIAGLTATDWPPASRPSALLSRSLQRQYKLPDADPDDTADYARRMLRRLCASAPEVNGSYARQQNDAEQTRTGLLPAAREDEPPKYPDPGYFAVGLSSAVVVQDDRDIAPAMQRDEPLHGGAGTLQRYFAEPFAAFAIGRLAVRPVWPFRAGLSPGLRGSLLHTALQQLYRERPAQAAIAGWSADERAERVAAAAQWAIQGQLRSADAVLGELLQREALRIEQLLERVTDVDLERSAFSIAEVELGVDRPLFGLPLKLRIDRIDRFDDGSIMIVDYKSGARKRFLDQEGLPTDMQLVVYAQVPAERVADLALMNVDTRQVELVGAGEHLDDSPDWALRLSEWTTLLADAAGRIRAGDARINQVQDSQAARSLALLTRVAELRDD